MNRHASMGIFWNIVLEIRGSLVGNSIAEPLLGISGIWTGQGARAHPSRDGD